MTRCIMFLMIITICAMPFSCNNVIIANENGQSKHTECCQQQSLSLNEQEAIKGYPLRMRRIGGPTDVEWDLDNSFPKRGSVLELILGCYKKQHQ